MSSEERFCLRWNNHQSHLSSVLESFLIEHEFVDVTLACDGKKVPAHKVFLSACSPYFRDLLKDNNSQHTIIVLRDISHQHVTAILQFVYHGEVKVAQEDLAAFLKSAESLCIQGLTDHERSLDTIKDKIVAVSEPDNCGNSEIKESYRYSQSTKYQNNQLPLSHLSQKRASLLDTELPQSQHKHQKVDHIVSPDTKNVNVKQEEEDSVHLEDEEFVSYSKDTNSDLKMESSSLRPDFWITQNGTPKEPSPVPQRSSVKLRNDLIAPIDPLAKAKARGFQLWNNTPVATQQPSMQAFVNNKPCVCNMCGKRFCYRNQLTEHKKMAHHMNS